MTVPIQGARGLDGIQGPRGPEGQIAIIGNFVVAGTVTCDKIIVTG